MKKIKLYLDDVRRAPDGWVRVRTATAAIAMLQSGSVEMVSLDHDLGNSKRVGNGYEVAVWLEENPEFLPDRWFVHSANPIATKRMKVALHSAQNRKRRLNDD